MAGVLFALNRHAVGRYQDGGQAGGTAGDRLPDDRLVGNMRDTNDIVICLQY